MGSGHVLGRRPDLEATRGSRHVVLLDPRGWSDFLQDLQSVTVGEGQDLPGLVVSSGTAVWSANVGADERCFYARRSPRNRVFEDAFLFPVYSPKRTWGVLEYLTSREEGLDEELRQTMTVLGYQNRTVSRAPRTRGGAPSCLGAGGCCQAKPREPVRAYYGGDSDGPQAGDALRALERRQPTARRWAADGGQDGSAGAARVGGRRSHGGRTAG